MKNILTIFLFMISFVSFSQKKSYDIGFSYGSYGIPIIASAESKDYFRVGFSYHLSDRWTITPGFMEGKFNYFESERSNADTEKTEYTTSTTNARGYESRSYLLMGYEFVRIQKFHSRISTGLSVRTQRLKYPYREPCSSGCAVFIGETSSTTLEIPVNVGASLLIKDRVGIGFIAGCYINSNASVSSIYFGPQIEIKIP